VVPPSVSRTWLLAGLARLVESRTMADRVLRVAIDGPDAAGKTTLADALAARIVVTRVGRCPQSAGVIEGHGCPACHRLRRHDDALRASCC
jgi:hypothetical protein